MSTSTEIATCIVWALLGMIWLEMKIYILARPRLVMISPALSTYAADELHEEARALKERRRVRDA
eukprot:173283-Pyramimonas_sp.AAC.1